MDMFYTKFKFIANTKNLSSRHIVSRCLYKAIKSKSENKVEVFSGLLKKAFTPGKINQHRPHPYYAMKSAIVLTKHYLTATPYKWGPEPDKDVRIFLDTKVLDYLTEEEIELALNIIMEHKI
jgi:hypothetical protein